MKGDCGVVELMCSGMEPLDSTPTWPALSSVESMRRRKVSWKNFVVSGWSAPDSTLT